MNNFEKLTVGEPYLGIDGNEKTMNCILV
uniref:Uncharacterized protein n=1 Tax=Anguilla anguilla TaxID=7936 RepID=A0A0E9XFC9_ANGAN